MIPLRNRSYFSLLQGTSSPEALCKTAFEYGYTGLAMTDRENLYGLWDFLAACGRYGLKPIIGAEVCVGPQEEPLLMLALDRSGYRNLCRIITEKKLATHYDLSAVTEEKFKGIYVLSRSSEHLALLHDSGVEVGADVGSRPTENSSRLRKFAAMRGILSVAVPDCSMRSGEDGRLKKLLTAIAGHKPLEQCSQTSKKSDDGWLKPLEFYRRRFAIWPEVVAASEEIAERCSFTGPDSHAIMPPWASSGSAVSAEEALRYQAYEGARGRYGDDLSETVVDRLEYELRVISDMGFASYFLIVRDIVHPRQPGGRRRQRRICGRGSGAASLVAYCLGITNVCPIRYNLYFERFLNPGRDDPPDIDIDFSWDERDDVLGEVMRDFADCAAMVCNHVFFKPRMAIRDTARAYGLPDYEISAMTRKLPMFYRSKGGDLQAQMADVPSLREQEFAKPWPEIIGLANRLIGLPRYISVHPGGVIITPDPVSNYVPVEVAAKGVPIIQWEKDGAEKGGLVKIDLLGNRSLAVIRDTIGTLKKNGVYLDEHEWEPEDDAETKAAVSRGKTMGCFYIESPAMRLLQKKAGTGDFEQLVIQSSIIRPAANEFVREYVRRLHGGQWQPLHPDLVRVLDETFGLMVYQEDVSRVAVALAGFSHSDADGLRKVLSKKDRALKLRDYREAFYQGCGSRTIGREDTDRIWHMMMSFDGYSFCKPHSASYARVSFQAAYLKTHYPAEFMAAVISNRGGYYSTFAYVSEAKRMGLVIEHPDVCRSDRCWNGAGGRIRVGLQAISGLSEEAITTILHCRKQRPFCSYADFSERVKISGDEMRTLIHAGALDMLSRDGNRSVVLWEAARNRRRSSAAVMNLFDREPPPVPLLPKQDRLDRLRQEYRALGFLCDTHPVCMVRGLRRRSVRAEKLDRYVGRSVDFVGWLLTGKLVSTKTGEVMEFLTFEDETGLVETTFFPGVYQKYAHAIESGKPYLLRGRVESDYGAITLTVESLERLGKGA